MHNATEITVSWMIILFLFILTLIFGVFMQRTSRVNTYHAQVTPVIERAGGFSDQRSLNAVSNGLKERNHLRFSVSPVKPADTHKVEGYGHKIVYRIHVQVPWVHFLNESYDSTTTSKVGAEND